MQVWIFLGLAIAFEVALMGLKRRVSGWPRLGVIWSAFGYLRPC